MSTNFPNLASSIQSWVEDTGQSMAELARILMVSKATITRWSQGEEPEVKRIKEVAKVLGVTVGYLADEEDIAHNDQERILLRNYRKANDRTRNAMQAVGNTADDLEQPKSK